LKKLYFLLAILTATLFATYDPINENEVLIINGAFHGKYDDYAYFEIESYGKYIKANYSESNRKYINEWKDYLSYIDFLEKYLFPTKKYNLIKGKDKITPEIFAFAERERERKRLAKLEAERLERERLAKLEAERLERERLAKLEPKAQAFLKYPREYSRNYNGVVSDGYGLEWQDNETSFKGNFNQAKNYCENLNLDNKTDWRLPTNKELWYLADRSKSDPAISPVFKNVKKSEYWSNQQVTYSGYESENWEVDFESGFNGWTERKSSLYTRCVRGKSFYEKIEFSRDSRSEIVTDKTNSLMWQDTSYTKKLYWNDAKNYCSNLKLGGYSDWRLPEIEELYSITDQRKTSSPFVNSNFQNIKTSYWYWSKLPVIKYSSKSWLVNFNYGYDDGWDYHDDDSFVVCVRDF